MDVKIETTTHPDLLYCETIVTLKDFGSINKDNGKKLISFLSTDCDRDTISFMVYKDPVEHHVLLFLYFFFFVSTIIAQFFEKMSSVHLSR